MMGHKSDNKSSPLRHIAIIMDGNNRWAKLHGKPSLAGHRMGAERIRDVLKACNAHGVEVLTLFAFSSENWRRPPKEVEALMGLFLTYLKREARGLANEGVRLQVIGNRKRFSAKLCQAIDEAESIANQGDRTLVIAADYGGRWDITSAAQTLAKRVLQGELDVDAIDEAMLNSATTLAGLPNLDLLIRTGGETRISNFLLWQAAYAELYFTETLWPEFDARTLDKAVADFHRRQRRFGLTGEQLSQTLEIPETKLSADAPGAFNA